MRCVRKWACSHEALHLRYRCCGRLHFSSRRSSRPCGSAIAAGIRVGVAMPIVGELFAGAENSQTRDKNLRILNRNINDLGIWPYDRAAAEEFGRIFAYLLRTGRLMQQVDIQIAAIAFALGSTTVVTYDSDFI